LRIAAEVVGSFAEAEDAARLLRDALLFVTAANERLPPAE
jgi:hypothetical protein